MSGAAAAGKPLKTFTHAELAQHVGQRFAEDDRPSSDQMLIAIGEYVYDCTKFASLHPGGKAVLRMVAGEDATEQFYALHNKEVLEKYHKRLCVGVLVKEGAQTKKADLALPAKQDQDLISLVPYAEIPLLRKNWVRQPWWTDSHMAFLVDLRKQLQETRPLYFELEDAADYVPIEMAADMGKRGILACFNGLSVMKVAQKLKDEGRMTFPGGIEPKNFDLWHEYLANQEFARSVPGGVRGGLSGGMAISLPAIAEFWRNPRKDAVVEDILLGNKRSCLAISEPHAGSDVAQIVTTAKLSKCGKFYIVNGIKKWITAGMNADLFSTAVRTGKGGSKGISFLLIDKSDPVTGKGVSVKHVKTSDSKSAATAWVYFDDCYVPVGNLMGEENNGFKLIMANFNHERWLICAGCMGGIRAVLQDCILWCMQRKVFGQTLMSQPVIRHKLARMIGAIESLEGFMESITYQMANMPLKLMMTELGGPIAILKYQATRSMTLVSDEACQLFGGRALTASGMGKNVEAMQRTFKFASILGGSEEIMADLGVRQALLSFPRHAKL
uniref:Cytochrome b5 heme-binding domain-containing protein n=1 Tax=Alexandrium catenella TaxID=2925 RepID=A0A7S1PXV8_ALECA